MTDELLARIQDRLARHYGPRLRGVLLYGSEARGQATVDSDIDILVLLEGPIRLWAETRAIVDALYDIQLEVIRPLHAMPVDAEQYRLQQFSLYRNAKREGRAA